MSLQTATRSGGALPPPASRGTGPRHRGRRTFRSARWDMKYSPYLLIAPFFILFAGFGAYPLVYTAWVSLHNWNIASDTHPFIGLHNYVVLLKDSYFWNAVGNTLGIFVVSTIPQLLIAMVLASLLNRGLRARTVLRMGILMPNITSTAAVGIIFSQLFARDYGLVNWILGLFGVHNIDWTASKWSAWIAVSTMVDWRWTGYNALIFLAAMQTIPRSQYESAALDGAGPWRQFRSITLPQLRPTLVFTTIIATIGGLQLFTEPLLFNSGRMFGGTLRQSQTVTMYMFENAFQNFSYGYGSAIAWTLFLLIVVISVLNFAIIRRTER